ncbi:MAG: preprotein translocase subunit SecY [Alphaproteobacteria bacterium]|nr:MAG: preprotein translocase subunit SecY [Alphaproteobacteria bacterium]
MASAAEQLAQNFNFGSFAKAKELRQRLLFALVALIVYRVGTYIPLPGIDPIEMQILFEQQSQGVLGIFNVFSGGSIERMAIFALGIMPYISSSIIVQLMTSVSPRLAELKKDGEAGRKKINQYTRYGTVLLTVVQGYGVAVVLGQTSVVVNPGGFFVATTIITLLGGTMFLMWLGEQITARGVGNGISLIIFAGIVAELPNALGQLFSMSYDQGQFSALELLALLLLVAGTIIFIVFVERSQRRLLVQYPKRQTQNGVSQGDTSHLPLKLNTAGVIPPIFASSLLLMPVTVAQFSATGGGEWMTTVTSLLGRGQPLFILFYAALIIFFCFFYTAIVFNPRDTADNLKKYGGFLPGIRPGERTAEHIDYVLTRITVAGAGYLTLVCLIPEMLMSNYAVPFYFGGTSLLIVVNVTMDTVTQVQSHLLAHQYEGLIKKARLRGGRRR